MEYAVKFEYGNIPDDFHYVKELMKDEYVRAYNRFCDITNGGLIDKLNTEFFKLYPDYKISDDLWSSVEYTNYFREGYTKVCDKLINEGYSFLLTFRIGDELEFIGVLKGTDKTISFHLEEIES